ncbi:MAG: hypothetical protein PHH71_03380 [Clostridia bacterium]|nr:hypothetical protein [Clostridia bacterium]MDD3232232.1 hypothetical protein [Clostridia bacterium]MDD4408820.1 hypothetical protein [Clostridia bacterium]
MQKYNLTVHDTAISIKPKGMAGERYVTKNFERQLNFYQDILNFILQDTMFQNSGGLFSGTSNENRFYFYNKQLKEMLGLKNILNQS